VQKVDSGNSMPLFCAKKGFTKIVETSDHFKKRGDAEKPYE